MVPRFQALESLGDGNGWRVVEQGRDGYQVIASELTESAAKRLAARLEASLGHERENAGLRERSGEVDVLGDRLAAFLYELMRDHLPAGTVERLVREACPDTMYTNGWLAEYARDLSRRLRG